MLPATPEPAPDSDCRLCERLAGFRDHNRRMHDGFFNAPVPSFGALDASLLVVGLAPGLKGANRTGRPFTGDYAGDLLYPTLLKFGFAAGSYGAAAGDGLQLVNCRITNAVRCVPPENKPSGPEIRRCNAYLAAEMAAMTNLRALVALGVVAHGAALRAAGERPSVHRFVHGAVHELGSGLILADSYHCSRYNTNTGRLTPAMFEAVFEKLGGILRR